MGKATRERRVAAVDRVDPTPQQFAANDYDLVQVIDPETGKAAGARRNLTTRNLERWHNRDLIDDVQFMAGLRYREDYERAGWQQRMISSYQVTTCGGQAGHFIGPGPRTEAQMDAWKRWRAARQEIDPALLSGFELMLFDDRLFGDVPRSHDRLKAWTATRNVESLRGQ